jgi:CHAD domain-containing protein
LRTTRRLREILPLVNGADTPLATNIRKAGRCLGRIRDLDIQSALLQRVEEQLPFVAPVTAVARAAIRERRRKRLRKAIKKIERLELRDLATSSLVVRPSWRQRLGLTRGVRAQLQTRTAERAAGVRSAVAHATGVYFPRRAHSARIAVKKLRYLVEVAAVTRVWRPRRVLKDLRRFSAICTTWRRSADLSTTSSRAQTSPPQR